jgi:hypothetical protein
MSGDENEVCSGLLETQRRQRSRNGRAGRMGRRARGRRAAERARDGRNETMADGNTTARTTNLDDGDTSDGGDKGMDG